MKAGKAEQVSAVSLLEPILKGIEHSNGPRVSSRDMDRLLTANRDQLRSWLSSRLFEALVASVGLTDYLTSILSARGDEASMVRLNSFLAAIHLSSSLNRLIFETLIDLKKKGRVNLTSEQFDALAEVLNPKSYRLEKPRLDVTFDPHILEDVRMEVQRSIYDQLDRAAEIPSDLQPIKEGENFSVSSLSLATLQQLSKRYRDLKLSVKDGFLIWDYPNRPIIYFKDGKAYHSLSESRPFTKKELDEQKETVFRLLRTRVVERCRICGDTEPTDLAYHQDMGVILVCSKCLHDIKILRVIPSVTPQEM